MCIKLKRRRQRVSEILARWKTIYLTSKNDITSFKTTNLTTKCSLYVNHKNQNSEPLKNRSIFGPIYKQEKSLKLCLLNI